MLTLLTLGEAPAPHSSRGLPPWWWPSSQRHPQKTPPQRDAQVPMHVRTYVCADIRIHTQTYVDAHAYVATEL